jgi:hypothetical protein
MPNVEYANGPRSSDFPRSWGEPPGDPYSDERRAWIARHIHNAPTRRGRTMSGAEAMAKVDALKGRSHLERNARLALFKAESLARSSEFALQRATHLALKR